MHHILLLYKKAFPMINLIKLNHHQKNHPVLHLGVSTKGNTISNFFYHATKVNLVDIGVIYLRSFNALLLLILKYFYPKSIVLLIGWPFLSYAKMQSVQVGLTDKNNPLFKLN